jgi:uncharacterized protein (DUF1778 family)
MSPQSMDSHLNFRMSSHDKKMIEAAAQFRGLKPHTYSRQKLLEAAEKDLAEMNQLNTLSLSDTDWEHFLAIMEAPVRINQNLKKAVKKFRKEFEQ